jgi:SAM-dependent methyltransferase
MLNCVPGPRRRTRADRDPIGAERISDGLMTAAWLDFWGGPHAIYVNARHKDVHYRLIANDIAQLVPFPQARVLDYGCGDALYADIVAAAAAELVLCEAAPQIRARLTARFGGSEGPRRNPKIRVIAPEEMERLPDHSFGLIVVHSVVQYLTRNETEALLSVFRRLLHPGGILIIGDVIPARGRALSDALALLRLAAANGFLMATLAGLARLLFSDYRTLRGQLGLVRYEEGEILQMLSAAGFAPQRARKNIGHDQARLAFMASPRSAGRF